MNLYEVYKDLVEPYYGDKLPLRQGARLKTAMFSSFPDYGEYNEEGLTLWQESSIEIANPNPRSHKKKETLRTVSETRMTPVQFVAHHEMLPEEEARRRLRRRYEGDPEALKVLG
jgi:hypothetical protein